MEKRWTSLQMKVSNFLKSVKGLLTFTCCQCCYPRGYCSIGYRNWYQVWGHWPGKLTTARGRSPRAVVSFPGRWWRNNDRNGGINFYSIMMKQNQLQINKRMQGKCSKLPQNCLSYSMVTCAQLAIVQWSHVTWLFLPGNTCSNHCDVKTRFVTLNFSHTLHKNNWLNTHYNSW